MASEEPAAKRQKLEAEAERKEDSTKDAAPAKEEEPQEGDAPSDGRPQLKESVAFVTEATTMNVMASEHAPMLTVLSEGGMQYLLAGARANVGVISGRYSFEVKLMESVCVPPDTHIQPVQPRHTLRVGVATAGSSLLIGGSNTASICFDTEGNFHAAGKKTRVATTAARLSREEVLTVVVNLNNDGVNSHTVTLFRNGKAACKPQKIPEDMLGQALYPAVTYRNVAILHNFGPEPLVELPFKCRMMRDAAQEDVSVASTVPVPKDGKYDVLFPVCLPDEGGFDWLDFFLKKNPHYTELSDRAILQWAELSDIKRGKGYGAEARMSNDKPGMAFGVPQLDDYSIRKMLQVVAPLQKRHYVVMEMKANLVKDLRKTVIEEWPGHTFKKVAVVAMGEPESKFKGYIKELMLKEKQEVLDAEYRKQVADHARKKLMNQKAREIEKRKKEAEKLRKKAAADQKKKIEAQKKEAEKKEQEQKQDGEDQPEEGKEEELEKESEEEKAEGEAAVESEDEKEDEVMEEPEPEKKEATLNPEEEQIWFGTCKVPDLTSTELSKFFTDFELPAEGEFDEVRFEWQKEAKCQERLQAYVQEKKLTARMEDLLPSDWFKSKFGAWSKAVSAWQAKMSHYKAMLQKKAADKQAKEKAREQKKRAAEAAKVLKQKIEAEKAKRKADEAAKKRALFEKKRALWEKKKEAFEKKQQQAIENGEEFTEEFNEEEPVDEAVEDEQREEDVEEKKDMEVDEQGEKDDEEEEELQVDFSTLDVFGCEDVNDIGGGRPLFSAFASEDWQMMTLRYELHLLCHAFRRDVKEDRNSIHIDNLTYYYNKFFKKVLNVKAYGFDNIAELLELVQDTVVVRPNKVVDAILPDLDSNNLFVMIAEESRRDRVRRIDLGDESAKLKIIQPTVTGGVINAGSIAVRPVGVGSPAVTVSRQTFQGARPSHGAVRPLTVLSQRPGPSGPWGPSQAPRGPGMIRPTMPVGGMVRPFGVRPW